MPERLGVFEKIFAVLCNPPSFASTNLFRIYQSVFIEIAESLVHPSFAYREFFSDFWSSKHWIIRFHKVTENLLVSYHGIPTSRICRLTRVCHTLYEWNIAIVFQIHPICYCRTLRLSTITKLRRNNVVNQTDAALGNRRLRWKNADRDARVTTTDAASVGPTTVCNPTKPDNITVVHGPRRALGEPPPGGRSSPSAPTR